MPRITKRAQRDLESLPPPLKAKAEAIIARLDNEPTLGKKLIGDLKGLRSARLGRSHRIIYTVRDEVAVLTVAPRRDAYR
jgi:mRNA-degrading endonuclease RelE of RelBE toxin-antitoxin system